MAKLPRPKTMRLLASAGDLHTVSAAQALWRVHDTASVHAVPWNKLRHYGPVLSCRWDPHPDPPGEHPDVGVTYLAADVPTALAERFQQHRRVINTRRGVPYLTGFRLARPVTLLNLTDTWPLRAGASHVLNTGRRDITREWARKIVNDYPHLDGLWSTSSMSGRPCVTLFTPAADALPAAPLFSEPLTHPGLATYLAEAAVSIGYRVLV